MAKPDCNDGWKKYAHELDAALAVADFAKRERIVLFEVFSQIFGRFRMKTAILSPIDINRRSGLDRHNVSRAILDLIKCSVLRREPDGRYTFLKDYESWTKNGKPRLSRKEIIYVAQAPFLARSYWEQNGIQEDTMGIQPDTVTVSTEIPNGIQIDTQTGPPLCTPPIQFENGELKQRSAAEQEPIQRDTTDTANAETTILPSVPAGPPEDRFKPEYPGDRRLLDIGAGSHEMPDATARAIFDRIWRTWGNAKVCNQFYSQQRLHDCEIWNRAIQALIEDGKQPGSIQLVHLRACDLEVARPSSNGQHPAKKPKPWEDTRTDAQKETLRLSLPEL
jgi:hypothetical protein